MNRQACARLGRKKLEMRYALHEGTPLSLTVITSVVRISCLPGVCHGDWILGGHEDSESIERCNSLNFPTLFSPTVI